MKKQAVWGTVAVLGVAGYVAGTWYMGERAGSAYREAVSDLRRLVGAEVLVSEQFIRGFWSSQGKLVLQWTPPAAADEAHPAGAAAPLRVTVENTVRHGPLAGWRLAAAVVETRIASIQGVDDLTRKAFAKVSTPTVTTVRSLTGSHRIAFHWPAGEVGEGSDMVRWKALDYRMNLNADRSRLTGQVDWPEISVQSQDDADSGVDGPAGAPGSAGRFAMALQGMKGDFDLEWQDGLWLLMPGQGTGSVGKMTVTRAAAGAAPGAAAAPLMALQDIAYRFHIERSGSHLGWKTAMTGSGSVGPVALQSLVLNETVSRIDVEAIKLIQKALLGTYKAEPGTALSAAEAPWAGPLMEAMPKLVAALPSYAMKLSAKVDGEQGELQYGIELKSAPDAQQIADGAWAPAMLQSSALHASLRLPKAWLPRLAEASGTKASPQEMEAMLGMAQAQGFVRQDGAYLTSAVRMENGNLVLNGKEIAMPRGQR